MNVNAVIRKATTWYKELQKNYRTPWKNRCQDYAYKKYIERPVIKSLLRKLIPVFTEGRYLDIGCGDGNETFFFRKELAKLGHKGVFFAFDPQLDLINSAKKINRAHENLPIIFDNGYLDELAVKHDLEKSLDLTLSTFVLQDLPDPKRFLIFVTKCMKPGTTAIFSLLHPDFAESLLRKKTLSIEIAGLDGYWHWAALYPIVEENNKTFFVSYFHRKIEDYTYLFQTLFASVSYMEGGPPSEGTIEFCKNKSISPFFDHPGNVYFPEIIEMPSSLFLIAKK